jgi:hypothetical protein
MKELSDPSPHPALPLPQNGRHALHLSPCLVDDRLTYLTRDQLLQAMHELRIAPASTTERCSSITITEASTNASARVGMVIVMAAPTTSDPPTGTSLLDLALGAGYAVGDQLWRARAACAGADPETFLTDRGAPLEPALVLLPGVRSPDRMSASRA